MATIITYTTPLRYSIHVSAMVVASAKPVKTSRADIQLPIVDLRLPERAETAAQIVGACDKFGFFQVINHGVAPEIISRMEEEAIRFFSRPVSEKQQGGPADPYGYGCKNIGMNGDTGEVEYLLLHTSPAAIYGAAEYISGDYRTMFSAATTGYLEAVRELACKILDLMEEGLCGSGTTTSLMSGLIRDVENDSALRLNHYPPSDLVGSNIGFGEHTDPQMLTILRSNGVEGLQISLEDGVWLPVPVNPLAFCVNVGDALQVMTNGRFRSVRHRAVLNLYKPRLSIAYFAAPPLNAIVKCLSRLAQPPPLVPPIYRSFSWAEYKNAAYSLRLGDSRLNLFKLESSDDQTAE